MSLCLEKVISGGQTGADLAGLKAAKLRGLETGGHAPKGYRTQNGPNIELKTLYGVEEHWLGTYPPRTECNVRNSDGTIRIAKDFNSSGEKCTRNFIFQHGKPYFDVKMDSPRGISEVIDWLERNNIKTLNVAGNSEKTAPGIEDFATNYLLEVFKHATNRDKAIQASRHQSDVSTAAAEDSDD